MNKQAILATALVVITLALIGGGVVIWVRSNSPHSTTAFGPDRFTDSKASVRFSNVTSAVTTPLNLAPDLASKAVPTNRWWTSALTGTWPENLFTTPFSFSLSAAGIVTGVPNLTVQADSITTGLQPDIKLSLPDTTLVKSQVRAYDDLSVTLRALSNTSTPALDVRLVEGSPFEYLTTYSRTVIALAGPGTVSTASDGRSRLSFSTKDQQYVLYSSARFELSSDKTSATVAAAKSGNSLVIAALPRSEQSTGLTATVDKTSQVVPGTIQAGFSENSATISWDTPKNTPTLFLLLPHQQTKETLALPSFGTYPTVSGRARLVQGSKLTIAYGQPALESSIPLPKEDAFFSRNTLERFLQQSLASATIPSATSYNGGKELFRLANLTDIAEKADSPTAPTFKQALRQELTDWLTYSPGEADHYFYYDPTVKGLVAVTPEFDSERFNDHHFHYGYFIYASSILGRYDKSFVTEYGAGVRALIGDIANTDRSDTGLPYLRVTDIYAGHSWAAGLARFGDGNNQESVSEAINAWYGIMLWGQASGDTALTQLGRNLYDQETAAAQTYYFNANPANPFPAGYNHYNVSLIWNSKATFETWFSAEPEAKHGILYLPLTGGSLYLQTNDLIKKDRAALATELAGKSPKGWQDILLMAEALENPKAAQAAFDPGITLDNSNSLAYLYVWLAWLGQR